MKEAVTRETIQKIISEYFAAIRAMDCARWVATFAEDAVSYDPADSPPIRGHENLRRFFTAVTAAFQKVGLTEDQVRCVRVSFLKFPIAQRWAKKADC